MQNEEVSQEMAKELIHIMCEINKYIELVKSATTKTKKEFYEKKLKKVNERASNFISLLEIAKESNNTKDE